MTDLPARPGIYDNLVLMDRLLTRGLNMIIANGSRFAEEGIDPPELRSGLVTYTLTLCNLLAAHHAVQEALTFPFLEERGLAAPYPDLEDQHRVMDAMIENLHSAALDLSRAEQLGPALDALCENGRALRSAWMPHAEREEAIFSADRIEPLLSWEERQDLAQKLLDFKLERAQPNALTVPFMIYNLSGEERQVMTACIPEEVIQRLTETDEWYEQWSPMVPFFLP